MGNSIRAFLIVGLVIGQISVANAGDGDYSFEKDIQAQIKQANMGKVEYMWSVGQMYETRKMFKKAKPWYQKAAKKNHAYSAFRLCSIDYVIEATPLNYQKQIDCYKKLATPNKPSNMVAVASSYYDRKKDENDINQAIIWYKKAIDADYYHASYDLGELYLAEFGSAKASEAANLFKNAIALGKHKGAMSSLAALYENGNGVPKDLHKAFELYVQSRTHYDGKSMFALARMINEGKVIPRDVNKSASFFADLSDFRNDTLKNQAKNELRKLLPEISDEQTLRKVNEFLNEKF